MGNSVFTGQPLDQPRVISPGVKMRETDWQGAAKHLSLPPEHPVRAAKGDLGTKGLPAPRSSFESGNEAFKFKPGSVRRKSRK